MTDPTREITEQERVRRDKLAALRDAGVEPYPSEAWATAEAPLDRAADVLARYRDAEHDPEADGTAPLRVRLAGRMGTARVMGKVAFFHLADESGAVQVYVRRDDLAPQNDALTGAAEGRGFYNAVFKKMLDPGDWLGVEGEVFRTQKGEVSVRAERLVLLAKSLRPLPVEKTVTDEETGETTTFNEVTDPDFRYRQRYADLAIHPETRRVFRQRARILRTIRDRFDAAGYLEVETPALQPIYGGAAARPFTTHHNTFDTQLFLRVADELYLKRLLVGGFEGVYEIAKDFRNEGISRFHNPEFTMLELYVAFRDYAWMMELVEELLQQIALDLHGTTDVVWGEHTLSFEAPFRRLPIFDAVEAETGYDLRGRGREELAAAATALGLAVDETMGAGKLIDEVFGAFVEPKLVQPAFVTDYPVELSPLAKRHRSEPGLVERFELIAGGKELCNAFSELNDPDEQRARFEDQVRLARAGDDEAANVVDEDFLRALEYGMPPAAGLGVGIDRLTMVMTNQPSIRDVLLFPLLRPEDGGDA